MVPDESFKFEALTLGQGNPNPKPLAAQPQT